MIWDKRINKLKKYRSSITISSRVERNSNDFLLSVLIKNEIGDYIMYFLNDTFIESVNIKLIGLLMGQLYYKLKITLSTLVKNNSNTIPTNSIVNKTSIRFSFILFICIVFGLYLNKEAKKQLLQNGICCQK